MKSNSLSVEQAKNLCEKNQYIIGDKITLDSEQYIVRNIGVSPCDKINMLLFLELYKEMKDLVKAVSFYKGTKFDVAVILAKISNSDEYKIMNLASYFEVANNRQEITINLTNNSFQAII